MNNDELRGLFEGLPGHIPPLYETPEANAPVQIFAAEEARLETPEGTAICETDVYLRWRTNSPSIVIEAEAEGAEGAASATGLIMKAFSDGVSDLQLIFPNQGKPVSPLKTLVFCTSSTISSGEKPQLRLVPQGGPLSTEADEITSVVFSLPNFWNYVGRPVAISENGTHKSQRGRLLLESEKWRVVLDAHPDTKRLSKELKRNGGYALTHTGRVERAGGENFGATDAEEFLTALAHFFTFARGFSVAPLLAVGFDYEEHRVWESWGVRTITPWQSGPSWFDRVKCAGDLETLFPKFMRKWKEPLWRDAISSALYWYARANRGGAATGPGTDGAIILAHSALDLLAWTLLVRDREAMSGEKYRNREFSTDNLRDLLNALGIPLGLPEHLETLVELAGDKGWGDGPRVLVEVRNGVVHPERGFSADDRIYVESWALGLRYVELTTLSLLGYEGRVADRTQLQRWQGQVEPVPWA